MLSGYDGVEAMVEYVKTENYNWTAKRTGCRYPCCSKEEGLNRGARTAAEDKILTDYITIYGEGKWRYLPKRAVVVHFRATGGAPILKQAKFKISGSDKFAKVIEFLCRHLGRETLFVYVNSAFSPNPDELVIDLYNVMAVVSPDEENDYALCNHCISLLRFNF
ncbi:hypothetical protein WN944_021786 [Citrus x changshan-huyou]|uniref:Ubiquitin-like protein ATG12 n=1 Tax=Citrus x changshan-huyou TaxID=2935761 RepID=A0AAP0N3R2_9ROSI